MKQASEGLPAAVSVLGAVRAVYVDWICPRLLPFSSLKGGQVVFLNPS